MRYLTPVTDHSVCGRQSPFSKRVEITVSTEHYLSSVFDVRLRVSII